MLCLLLMLILYLRFVYTCNKVRFKFLQRSLEKFVVIKTCECKANNSIKNFENKGKYCTY